MQFYARDIMTPHPITARPEMMLEEMVEVLIANKISGAPVVDDDGKLVGVISVFDVLMNSGVNYPYTLNYYEETRIDTILAEEGFHVDSVTEGYVSDAMTKEVYTVRPDTPLETMADTMLKKRIHRLVVVNDREEPVGVVSTFDLLKLLAAKPSSAAVV